MINLPHNHLSWSQIELWNRSKSQYIDRYINEVEQYETKELRFGKDFAKEVEKSDVLTTEIKLCHEIEGVKVLGFLDQMKDNSIIEYKTGKEPWTQERVDTHGQLALYTLLYFEEFQEMPKKVMLIWNETKEVDIVSTTPSLQVLLPLFFVFSFILPVLVDKVLSKYFVISEEEKKEIEKSCKFEVKNNLSIRIK